MVRRAGRGEAGAQAGHLGANPPLPSRVQPAGVSSTCLAGFLSHSKSDSGRVPRVLGPRSRGPYCGLGFYSPCAGEGYQAKRAPTAPPPLPGGLVEAWGTGLVGGQESWMAASPGTGGRKGKRGRKPSISLEPPQTSGKLGQAGTELARCQQQADEVTEIMLDNFNKVLERDGKLSELEERSDQLRMMSSTFNKTTEAVVKKQGRMNARWRICLGLVVGGALLLILIVLLVLFLPKSGVDSASRPGD
ncbi:PREDICTED: uncharacterized protein LOC102868900 [Elephantulus edwardii]|uniref:uncharacterized protein LOC102868900 n=1 Tax=Elephantulus edwardii TaxID=28737 RepID=UPI0003F0CC67|nr:PREDICTED: uncharacterized protein LOC102868900 [Elephantulus edwardii]